MSGKQYRPAMVRMVNALMWALGGATVKLRVASVAVEGLERELGMTATTFHEMELSPVVVRSIGKEGRERVEVLVSSSALDLLMPACGMADGMEFLKKVREIVCGERVFAVTGVSAERFAGVEYMYRLAAVSNQ